MSDVIEIVPAILRTTFERVQEDWERVFEAAAHVQIDVADGVFAGDPTFDRLPWLKKLPQSVGRIELHMMVQRPEDYFDDIVVLQPAQVVFHIESFATAEAVEELLKAVKAKASAEVGLAINPETPLERLTPHVELIDYVQFMGIKPGWTNQPLVPAVFDTIAAFKSEHPDMLVSVDGHVNKETIPQFVAAGARKLCAATAIFKEGDAVENMAQLKLVAEGALEEVGAG